MRHLLAIALTGCSLGCYTAMPLPAGGPAVGNRVAVTLTDAGRSSMAAQIGPAKAQLIGDVKEATDTTLVLALRSVTTQRGIEELWSGEQVVVPRSAIGAVGSRKVAAGRSAFLALAVTAGLVALAAAVGVGGFGADRGGDVGGTQ